MKKLGVALLALMWTGPAWATMCDTGDALGPTPSIRVCVAGSCDETKLAYTCDSASGASFWGYENGLALVAKPGKPIAATMNGRKIPLKQIKCTGAAEDACYLGR